MIDRTSAMVTHMASRTSRYCLLFNFVFATGNERLATTADDKTWNSFTWSAAGPLLSLPPLRMTTETAQTNFVLIFSAATTEWTNRIMNHSRGRLCRWWIAGVHATTGAIVDDPLPMPTLRMVPGGMESTGETATVSLALEDFFYRNRNIAPRTRSHFDQLRLFAPALSVSNDQSFYDVTTRTQSQIAPTRFTQRQGFRT